MSGNTAFVFALIAIAGVMMASNRVRFDIVSLLGVLALMLSGVLTVGPSLAGFGSSVVIMVAALLVVGEMLDRTGVARAVGDWILKKGGRSESRLLVLIMVGAAVLGSVMSSTAVVAIFIPIVLRIAAETSLNASRMLMPMSYAALISGMLTLIATTPNIVVHEELKGAGFEGFGFFSFAPVGLAVLAVAVIYVLFIGRRLLSEKTTDSDHAGKTRSIDELFDDFRMERNYGSVRITESSSLIGKTIAELDLENSYEIELMGLMRREARGRGQVLFPAPELQLQQEDILLMVCRPEERERLISTESVEHYQASPEERQRWLWEIGAVSIMIHPNSSLLGQTAQDANINSRYNLRVLGMRRNQEAIADYANTPFAPADTLLIAGPWSSIQRLQADNHEFIVLETPTEKAEIVPSYRKLPVALTILAGMVLLTLFEIVPLVAAVLMAALAAIFTKCLTVEDAYRSIHWPSLVLIGGMLPLADALDATGGTRMIVDALLAAAGESSPYVMLSVIFFLTAGLGLVLSNTASAVLVAPIAIYAAAALGVSPYPFAVAVLIAASAAYSTPVSTPVVTLVVEPGKYGFADFIKVGVPLLFLTYLATLLVAPLIFPFHPA